MNFKIILLVSLTTSLLNAANPPPPVTRVVGTPQQIVEAQKVGVKKIVYDPTLAPVLTPKGPDRSIYDYSEQWSTNYWTVMPDGQRAIVMVKRDGSTTTVLQPKESVFPVQPSYQPQANSEPVSGDPLPPQQTISVYPVQQIVAPQIMVPQQVVYVRPACTVWSYPAYRPYYGYHHVRSYSYARVSVRVGGCWSR